MLTMQWFFGDREDLSDAYAVRRRVFIEEQGIAESDEYDGTDGSCIHAVIYDNNIPVSTGRVMVCDDFVIGRVAVVKSYRGRGLGEGIMRALIRACVTMGGDRQILHAQISAKVFYEKLGFTAYGDEFEEAGIPHVAMERFGEISCNLGKD